MIKKTICILSLILGINSVNSQEFYDEFDEIHINETERKLHFEVTDEVDKVKPKISLVYYWFKSQELHNSKGGFSGRLLHGNFIEYYPDNSLKESGNFYLGVKHGVWKGWHANGELAYVEYWKKGLLFKTKTSFNEQGEKLYQTSYKKGLKDGIEYTYKNNKIVGQTLYKKDISTEKNSSSTSVKIEASKNKTNNELKAKEKESKNNKNSIEEDKNKNGIKSIFKKDKQ